MTNTIPSLRITVILVGLLALSANLRGDECATCADSCCCWSKSSLMKMSCAELLAVYRTLPAVDIPGGYYKGTMMTRKGVPLRGVVAGATSLVWQGKWIKPECSLMINQVMGHQRVTAHMAMGESWVDDGEAMIFDYQCSSAKFARDARDEVRQLCPGLYLGIMWIRQECDCPKLSTFFLLEETCSASCCCE